MSVRTMLSVGAAVGVLAGFALATNYHVDAVNGDDTLGNGSVSAPWRTITRAHQATLLPGDRVLVAPGVYDSAIGEVFPITLKAQVTVVGAGSERTFVRGPAATLFKPGGGQTWYRLMDMALTDASTAVLHATPGDTFLLLERLVLEDNATAVLLTDGPGIYAQCALFNCLLRGNDVGLWVDEAWSGFGGVFGWAYGCTLVDNGTAIRGTNSFGNQPMLLVQHSIIMQNDDDLFVDDVYAIGPTIGCVTSEPSLIGRDGNVDVPPSFINASGLDPHLRNDSGARDLIGAETTFWPPAPTVGVPGPEWWGVSFAASFDAMPDIDGRVRTDGSIDAGCDENEAPFVYVNRQPSIGAPVDLVILNSSPAPVALYLSAGASQSIPTQYGTWKLDSPFLILATFPVDAQGHLVLPAVIPTVAAFVGVDIYMQGHGASPPIALSPVAWLRILP
jgi:hypothetical protein